MSVEKDIFLDVTHDEDVRKAIGLIYTLKVSPPEHRLLVSFVRDAVDAKATALYVLKRIYRRGQDEVDVQTELQALLLEWRSVVERFYTDKQVPTYVSTQVSVRDRNACCITGQTRVWWDIFGWSRLVYLQVVPETILSDEDTESSPGLVSIFLTDEKLAQLSKDIKGESIWSQLRNTWTLRQDVAAACKIGLFMTPGWNQARKPLEDLKAMCVYRWEMPAPEPFPILASSQGSVSMGSNVRLITSDPGTLPLPSAFLFEIRERFSNSLRAIDVHKTCLAKRPKSLWDRVHSFFCDNIAFRLFCVRGIWLKLPQSARIYTYRALLVLGRAIYGPKLPWVQRVPFGMYIKHGRGALIPAGEATALFLVETHTQIPAPRLVEKITQNNYTYLVMTQVPGETLHLSIPFMTYAERDTLAMDLRECLSELSNIPNHNKSLICGPHGGPVFDYRIYHHLAGPFDSEESFNNHIITQDRLRSPVHSTQHKIHFTHADINLWNILVKDGKLSGLVDFGCAGFYPEYWEFTKAMFSVFGDDPASKDLIETTFGDRYLDEFEAEKKLWKVNSTF